MDFLKLNFRKIWANEEFKFYSLVVIASTILIAVNLFYKHNLSIEQSFRDSVFQVVSIVYFILEFSYYETNC